MFLVHSRCLKDGLIVGGGMALQSRSLPGFLSTGEACTQPLGVAPCWASGIWSLWMVESLRTNLKLHPFLISAFHLLLNPE